MIVHMSGLGEEQFLNTVMGEYAELLMCKDMKPLIRQGVRRIQELAFTPIYPLKKKLLTAPDTPRPRYRPRHLRDEDALSHEEAERLREIHALGLANRWTRDQRNEYDDLVNKRDRAWNVIWERERLAFEAVVRQREEMEQTQEREWDAPQPEVQVDNPPALDFNRLIFRVNNTWAAGLVEPVRFNEVRNPVNLRIEAAPEVAVGQWVIDDVEVTGERDEL
jgi:hypothetical protein